MKHKKNKSDPTEFLKFDNLISKINNKFQNDLTWKKYFKKKALNLISINFGTEDEIYKKLSDLEIQNLQDIVELKKLIEEARDKHLKNEIKKSLEENKNVHVEVKDTKKFLERK